MTVSDAQHSSDAAFRVPPRRFAALARVVGGAGVTAVLALALASPAAAHLALRHPRSRYGDTVLKVGPCGVAGGARSDNVTVLEPGAAIDVGWDEYVDHPGHFRIAFDADGDDDFVDPTCSSGCDSRSPAIELYSNAAVLLDGIADTAGGLGSARVVLPDVECSNCTLQVIQVMYDKPPYVLPGDDIYYQCADLVLRRSSSRTPTPSPSPSATPARSPPRTPPSATATSSPRPTVTPTRGGPDSPDCTPTCLGDCDGSGAVDPGELRSGIAIALGVGATAPCGQRFDRDLDGAVTIDELIAAAAGALAGCRLD